MFLTVIAEGEEFSEESEQMFAKIGEMMENEAKQQCEVVAAEYQKKLDDQQRDYASVKAYMRTRNTNLEWQNRFLREANADTANANNGRIGMGIRFQMPPIMPIPMVMSPNGLSFYGYPSELKAEDNTASPNKTLTPSAAVSAQTPSPRPSPSIRSPDTTVMGDASQTTPRPSHETNSPGGSGSSDFMDSTPRPSTSTLRHRSSDGESTPRSSQGQGQGRSSQLESWLCRKCNKRFKSNEAYKKHILRKCSKPFQCELCENTFASFQTLINHKRTHLNDAKKFNF